MARDETAMIALILGLARVEMTDDPANRLVNGPGLAGGVPGPRLAEGQQALEGSQIRMAAQIAHQQVDGGGGPLRSLPGIGEGEHQRRPGMRPVEAG
jgi:hypothetical protein